MTNLSEQFTDALVRLVSKRTGDDAVEVLRYEDDTVSSGGCETCYFEYAVVNVTYRTTLGDTKTWQYSAGFSELVQELLEV